MCYWELLGFCFLASLIVLDIIHAFVGICRLCHTGVFSERILLDYPSVESRYATHWVER